MASIDLDKLLRATRAELEQKYGAEKLDYYRPPLVERWRQQDLRALADGVTREHVEQALVK